MTQAREAASDELEQRIRAERVRLVFLQSPLPILISPVAAAVLAAALWHAADHQRLLIWSSGMAVLALLRLVLVRAYPSQGPEPTRVVPWERAFVGTVLAVALWWGIGGLTLLVDAWAERIVVFCFLMLMAGGSAASYAAHPPTVRWTTLALTAPITIHFATVDDTLHRALAFGAVMYVAATFRSISKLGDFFARTHSLSHEVQRQRDRAEALARTDPLTGLNNRRAFYELGELAMRHAARYEHPLSMVMIDIDRFKSINDEFGHGVGDAVIRSLAKLIDKHYRNTDISCRFGGEEFAVLLPETDLDGALLTAERLRNVVEEHVIICEGHKLRFTASFGVAAMCTGQSLDDLLVTADRALYEAKRTGRNSVRPHSEKPAVSSAMGSA